MRKNIIKMLFSMFFLIAICNVWADSSSNTVEGVVFKPTVQSQVRH